MILYTLRMVFIVNGDMMSRGVGCIWIEAANDKHILIAYFIDLQIPMNIITQIWRIHLAWLLTMWYI